MTVESRIARLERELGEHALQGFCTCGSPVMFVVGDAPAAESCADCRRPVQVVRVADPYARSPVDARGSEGTAVQETRGSYP